MSTTETSQGSQPTKQPTPGQDKLIKSILKLYQLQPSHESYNHYAEDAVFHDPVSIAKGKESIMSQFNGMPKIFARSETKGIIPQKSVFATQTNNNQELALLASSTPSQLEVNLTQHYVFKSAIPLKSEGAESTVNSKLTFKLNEQGLIKEHHEEWDHKGNKDSNDGFFGKLQEQRKKIDAKLVEKMVESDPDKL